MLKHMMKASSAIAVAVVIFALLVVGWALFAPSKSTTVLAPTPEEAAPTPVPATFGEVATGTPTPSPTASPSPAGGAQTQATVSITDTGFVPTTLTVPAGTTVKFVNNGQGSHWPASDPHPVHNGLAGFDALGALATGDSYSFTFAKVGSWGYHDHLRPEVKGTVIVQ